MAGVDYCRITPDGDVTPCPYMTAVAGNVRDGGFTRVWNDSELLRSLRDPALLGGRCGGCEFRELCGGCRCRAYAHTGDVLAEDPGCTYVPTGLPLDERPLVWSAEARARRERIPISFIRGKVERGVEAFARRRGAAVITPQLMEEAIQGSGRGAPVFATAADA
jgi:radical SAM protein with 4Fe4S-binding SPASM domain